MWGGSRVSEASLLLLAAATVTYSSTAVRSAIAFTDEVGAG